MMDVKTVLDKTHGVARESGLTYQQIGLRMGYPPESARQSAWKFLHGRNPTVAQLIRFADAMGVETRELL